jgi:hypothetical protein
MPLHETSVNLVFYLEITKTDIPFLQEFWKKMTVGPVGRNAVFCALRYKIPLLNIGATKFNSNVFFERLKSEIPTDQLDLAIVLREAILICDTVLSLYDSRFLRDDFVCFISECST